MARQFVTFFFCYCPLLGSVTYCSEAERKAAYRNAFESRGHAVPMSSIAIHVNDRYIEREGLPAIAKMISDLCEAEGAVPIFIAMGPCHGDERVARSLGEIMGGQGLVVDQPGGLLRNRVLYRRVRGLLGNFAARPRDSVCSRPIRGLRRSRIEFGRGQVCRVSSSSGPPRILRERQHFIARVDSWTAAGPLLRAEKQKHSPLRMRRASRWSPRCESAAPGREALLSNRHGIGIGSWGDYRCRAPSARRFGGAHCARS